MSLSYYYTLADTLSTLSVTFTQPNGTVVNLTGYTVTLRLRHQATGATAGPFTMTVSAPLTGVATYTFAASDITLSDGWDYQCKAAASTSIIHLPNTDQWEQMWVSPAVESATNTRPYQPTAASLWRFLEAHGLTVSAALRTQLKQSVEGALRAFEQATNRRPFLAGATDILKRFDPPTQRVDGRALLFIPPLSSLTSLIYTPTGSTSTTLVAGTDYDLLPYDASDTDNPLPYDRIQFYRYGWSNPLSPSLRQSLYALGKWGSYSTFPEDAYLAVLAGASASLWTQIRHSNTGGVLGWKDGDRSVDYGIENWKSLAGGWSEQFDRAVATYRRYTL